MREVRQRAIDEPFQTTLLAQAACLQSARARGAEMAAPDAVSKGRSAAARSGDKFVELKIVLRRPHSVSRRQRPDRLCA